ncbi:MAG: putative Zn-dependent protease, partial [Planctomycetota bacterium]
FLAKNPKHPGILQGAIQIHMEHGNKKRALPYAKRLLELFPNEERLKDLIRTLE